MPMQLFTDFEPVQGDTFIVQNGFSVVYVPH